MKYSINAPLAFTALVLFALPSFASADCPIDELLGFRFRRVGIECTSEPCIDTDVHSVTIKREGDLFYVTLSRDLRDPTQAVFHSFGFHLNQTDHRQNRCYVEQTAMGRRYTLFHNYCSPHECSEALIVDGETATYVSEWSFGNRVRERSVILLERF